MRTLWRAFALAVSVLWLPACSVTPAGSHSGPHWGADATVTPGWSRLGKAALTAATDPLTWLPAAGAAGLQIGGADADIADWANEETPLFGSRSTAEDASDWLRTGSYVLYGAAGLAAPAPEGRWLTTKAKGFAIGGAALLATRGLTDAGKAVIDRRRPTGSDDDAFPSGHASMTAAAARLTHDTLRYYELAPAVQFASDIGLAGLALTTAWARVEAGEHHPGDVLAGMALGNFIAVFATEAFLAPATDGRMRMALGSHGDGMMLQLSLGF